jgi:hypothetical protein
VDPVSLIVAALAAGAVAGAQTTATDAVKDAYTGLKELVRRRLSGRESGRVALARHEDKPQQWAGALEAELVRQALRNRFTERTVIERERVRWTVRHQTPAQPDSTNGR